MPIPTQDTMPHGIDTAVKRQEKPSTHPLLDPSISTTELTQLPPGHHSMLPLCKPPHLPLQRRKDRSGMLKFAFPPI
jgi:hypothetical protein